MKLSTTKKIIAAVLTAVMAVSPVFMMPTSASDGQDVEDSASSWRYQDGDIIVDEGLNPFDADAADYDLEEDFNSQMGSSIVEEELAEDPADGNVPDETTAEPALPGEEESGGQVSVAPEQDQMAEETAEGEALTEQPTVQSPEQTAEEQEQIVEEPEQIAEEPEQITEAPDQSSREIVQESEEVALTEEDPGVQIMSAVSRDRYWTWSKGKYRRGPGYLKGIDVSYWQGKIDWKKVKAAGVDFAIIRCGYGSNKSSQDDSKFAANVKGCVANGIPYGVYLYAHANTVSKAKDEADHAIRLLKANKCRLSYPIYYDLEDRDVARAGSATIVKMANAFCSKLKKAGYPSGVYANLNWWNNKLSNFSGYDRWVAQWSTSCSYKKTYSIWQCTSSTTVSGISGRVDANLLMCPKADIDKYMNRRTVTYDFKTIDGKVYLVGSNGWIVKDKFCWKGVYLYAFDKNGVRQAGKKYRIGYKSYRLDSKGRAYLFKAKAKKKIPYYAKAGTSKKGKLKKGKTFYVLRTSGKWSQMANGYWVKTSKIKKTVVYPTITPSVKVKYKAKLKKKTTSRSGPASKYVKKKTFKKNKTVTVIGTYGSWSKVSTGQWLPSSKLKRK